MAQKSLDTTDSMLIEVFGQYSRTALVWTLVVRIGLVLRLNIFVL